MQVVRLNQTIHQRQTKLINIRRKFGLTEDNVNDRIVYFIRYMHIDDLP